MPFPLRIGVQTFHSAPLFAHAVINDCRAGGGTVVPGLEPSQWVPDLVRTGALEPDLAIALGAALLRAKNPAAISEGARIAMALGDRRLGEMLPNAVAGHDMGLLLHTDPLRPGQSVEDALLRAWASVGPLSEPETRAEVLDRMRNASLIDAEIEVLALWATPQEIRRWLPAVVVEGLPHTAMSTLAAGFRRGADEALALCDGLAPLSRAVRAGVWEVLDSEDPGLAALVRARLLR
jgi:hypothetical protein